MDRKNTIILASLLLFSLSIVLVGLFVFSPDRSTDLADANFYEYIRPPTVISENPEESEFFLEEEIQSDVSLSVENSIEESLTEESIVTPKKEPKIPTHTPQAAPQTITPDQDIRKPQSVTLQKSNPPPPQSITIRHSYGVNRESQYWIQVLSTSNWDRVQQARHSLHENFLPSTVKIVNLQDKYYFRLRIGPFAVKEEATKFLGWILDLETFSEGYILLARL